jgi:hypothetical protein
MSNTELIQKISTAFSDGKFPGNENIVAPSYGEEPELVRAHFYGQSDWENLTPQFLDLDGAISFLSDVAFRFYLPAFMIADINEQLNFNDPSIRLCWAVTPQTENQKIAKVFGSGTIGERAKKCFDEINKEQVNAVVAYLRWKLLQDENNNTIKQALDHYWLKRIKP